MSLTQFTKGMREYSHGFLYGREREREIMFERFVESIEKAFDWTHRNFQYGPTPGPQAAGGRGGGRNGGVIGFLEFEVETILPPFQRATHNVWGRKDVRLMLGFPRVATISSFVGVIDVEEAGGSPVRYFVRCMGPDFAVPAGHLVGFDLGFGRFDADVKKALVRVSLFGREATNPNPAELKNLVPIRSGLFTSDEPVLTEQELQSYKAKNLRYRCQLTIHGAA